jgi:hypothetical protein
MTPGPADEDRPETGLPVLSTWGRVYGFVTCCFVVWVGAMVWLELRYR